MSKKGFPGGVQPSSGGSHEQKGFQPTGGPGRVGGVQGGYQGPTGQGAPANPPSGGSSGKK